MLLAFRTMPNNKGVFEPQTEPFVDARKTFVGGNGFEVRFRKPARGKSEPDILHDTAIVPWLIAESVLKCASEIVGEPIPREYVEKLIICARDVYGARQNKRFRSKLRGKYGREYMHMWMQHWLTAHLCHNHPQLGDRLPREFSWPSESWRDYTPCAAPPRRACHDSLPRVSHSHKTTKNKSISR